MISNYTSFWLTVAAGFVIIFTVYYIIGIWLFKQDIKKILEKFDKLRKE